MFHSINRNIYIAPYSPSALWCIASHYYLKIYRDIFKRDIFVNKTINVRLYKNVLHGT